jgi:hypothetical protein
MNNTFQNLLNYLKKVGSSGSQFSIQPTISNTQVGNSVQQIENMLLPTPVTPLSGFGSNSIIRKKGIDKALENVEAGQVPDFSKINDGILNLKNKTDNPTTTGKTTNTDITVTEGKDPDLERRFEMMKEYLQLEEDALGRASDKQFKQAALYNLPGQLEAAFGGTYASALQPGMANLAQIAANSRPYQFGAVNIPTRTNFAALLG